MPKRLPWQNIFGLPLYDHPDTPAHMLDDAEVKRRLKRGQPVRYVIFQTPDGRTIVDPEYLRELDEGVGDDVHDADLIHVGASAEHSAVEGFQEVTDE